MDENRSLAARQDKEDQGMWSGFSRIALYISILMIPLTLVAVLRPETDHGFVYELGKNFALLGFTIIALQFLLSARFESIERPFGQDMLLHFHKWMAVFATSLLLIHPLLLAAGDKGWPLLIALDVPMKRRNQAIEIRAGNHLIMGKITLRLLEIRGLSAGTVSYRFCVDLINTRLLGAFSIA